MNSSIVDKLVSAFLALLTCSNCGPQLAASRESKESFVDSTARTNPRLKAISELFLALQPARQAPLDRALHHNRPIDNSFDALRTRVKSPLLSLQPTELNERLKLMHDFFPKVDYMDSFVTKLEDALAAPDIGITGANAIAITTLCRDECVRPLQDHIEAAFGESFNAHGLGGLPTLGQTGMKVALSHAPKRSGDNRERYVFFAMPHIAIDEEGQIGEIARPGRSDSRACEALIACLDTIKESADDLGSLSKSPQNSLDPELSLLLTNLAGRFNESEVGNLDLLRLTKEAQVLIEEKLLELINATVDTKNSDYAVVTGVQIHSSSKSPYSATRPTLEFIAPASVYAVVNGEKKRLEISESPRSPVRKRKRRILRPWTWL